MIINKKSWHYRYLNLVHSDIMIEDADNLCEYIRKFVATTILYIGSIATIAMFGFIVTRIWMNLPVKVAEMACFPVGVLVIAILFGLCYLAHKVNEWRTERKIKKNTEKLKAGVKVEPSPFVQYVKDKHNKLCSFIEFEE